MATKSLEELFDDDDYDRELFKFERIKHPFSTRRDIHALILLNQILPGTGDIISCAEHDQIWLDADCDEFAELATDEQVLDLRRCGVFYDKDVESLSMFV